MRISKRVLGRFVSVDLETPRSLRLLLDDLGIEVKRMHEEDGDTYYDRELLANRGDHRSYQGIAREIHARTDRPLSNIDAR